MLRVAHRTAHIVRLPGKVSEQFLDHRHEPRPRQCQRGITRRQKGVDPPVLGIQADAAHQKWHAQFPQLTLRLIEVRVRIHDRLSLREIFPRVGVQTAFDRVHPVDQGGQTHQDPVYRDRAWTIRNPIQQSADSGDHTSIAATLQLGQP